MLLIWGNRKAKYFCGKDSTAKSQNSPSGKSIDVSRPHFKRGTRSRSSLAQSAGHQYYFRHNRGRRSSMGRHTDPFKRLKR